MRAAEISISRGFPGGTPLESPGGDRLPPGPPRDFIFQPDLRITKGVRVMTVPIPGSKVRSDSQKVKFSTIFGRPKTCFFDQISGVPGRAPLATNHAGRSVRVSPHPGGRGQDGIVSGTFPGFLPKQPLLSSRSLLPSPCGAAAGLPSSPSALTGSGLAQLLPSWTILQNKNFKSLGGTPGGTPGGPPTDTPQGSPGDTRGDHQGTPQGGSPGGTPGDTQRKPQGTPQAPV